MKTNTERIIELAIQIKNGDQSGFTEFYNLTSSRAYFIALKLCGNKFDAEDAVQESYMVLLSHISSLEKTESVQSWFGRIVANKSKDLLKKKNPLLFSEGDERNFDAAAQAECDCSLEETVENAELAGYVMHEIGGLTEEKRECVIMKYYNDLSVAQIADSIGVPVSTVKNRLWTARKDLMNALVSSGITAA